MPQVVVIAGPSGSGKSRHFPARDFGAAFFNVDDRCAELNGGSYHATPVAIRKQAQAECEQFINDCTARGISFAVESTLRTTIAIEQAARARAVGFRATMVFVATDNVEENIRRIERRGLLGGHSASEGRIRQIYESSLRNLRVALDVFDELRLYDNAGPDAIPRFVRHYVDRQIVFEATPLPAWLP